MAAEDIGTIIRAARKRQGVTQEELAKRLGAHRRYVSALENGHSTLALRRALEAFDVLGLDVSITDNKPAPRKRTSPRPAANTGNQPQSLAHKQSRSPLRWLRRRRQSATD
ncbi:helix-turn-helix domain-containing protein [Pseudactinotalea sp. Z1748]